MLFPTTSILDSFGGTLSGWTTPAYGNAALSIVTGQVTSGTASAFAGGEWAGGSFGDTEVYCTIATKGLTGEQIVLHLRESGNTSTWNGYALRVNSFSGLIEILRVTSGNVGATVNSITQAITNGDGVGLRIQSSYLTAWYRSGAAGNTWTNIMSGTDTTYTVAGPIGLEIYSTTYKIDDFGGGLATETNKLGVFGPMLNPAGWF